jgi:hypothetical protein
MVDFLLNKVASLSFIMGVDLTLVNDGVLMNVCVLQKKGGQVQMVFQKTGCESLKELSGLLKEETPIALSISGKGILHKEVGHVDGSDISRVLLQAIPNAKASDFYLQFVQQVDKGILSIGRKSSVDDLLNKFLSIKANVVSVTFGGLALGSMAFLLGEVPLVILGPHQFKISKGEVMGYEYGLELPGTDLTIGTDQIPHQVSIAYANAFQHFLGAQVRAEIAHVENTHLEFRHKQLFQKLGWGVLIFFLVVLMGNYGVYSSLSSDTEKLRIASTLQQSQVEQLRSLKKEVAEKEKFLQNAGWMEASKASFYADRIASTVPESVHLIGLSIKPLDERQSRELRKQVFSENLIVLEGTCKQPIDLNGWIKRLKDFPWAKKVNVENYRYDSGERTGNFKVEITL